MPHRQLVSNPKDDVYITDVHSSSISIAIWQNGKRRDQNSASQREGHIISNINMRHKQDINKWHETQSANLPVHQLERALSPTLFDRSPPRRTSNSVAGKSTSQGRQPGTISEDKRKSRQSEDSEELKESDESERTLGRCDKGSSKASTEMESQFGEHIDELGRRFLFLQHYLAS